MSKQIYPSPPFEVPPNGFRYTIQCVDLTSNKKGDFLHLGDFRAVSPVFTDIVEFFDYLKTVGLKLAADRIVKIQN